MRKKHVTIVTHRNSGISKVMADDKEYEVAGSFTCTKDSNGWTRVVFMDETLTAQHFITPHFTALVV